MLQSNYLHINIVGIYILNELEFIDAHNNSL